MLVRGKRTGIALSLLVVPILLFLSLRLYDDKRLNQHIQDSLQQANQWTGIFQPPDPNVAQLQPPTDPSVPTPPTQVTPPLNTAEAIAAGLSVDPNRRKNGAPEGTPPLPPHRELFSLTKPDRKYYRLIFGQQEAMNPNIIPHPSLNDTWIMVAQLQRSDIENSIWFAEIGCNAKFNAEKTALACVSQPMQLPISATQGDKCEGELSYFNFNVGPHDGRVFFGPEHPYAIYGSNSKHTCFGMFMQDLRMLVDWGFEFFGLEDAFRMSTELQRPPPWGPIEKNWFVFWDQENNLYVHYDSWPKRSFARIGNDGSVKQELASKVEEHDTRCIKKFMQPAQDTFESIHQATNSLAVTMCKRGECEPSEENTFVLTIYQFKTFWSFHGVYEPYAMLFQQVPPFAVHAIAKNPYWISGRGAPGAPGDDPLKSEDQTEMIYVTSISWKDKRNKYQGYLDDVMFLAFGIEDDRPGAIDVMAGDLVRDLGLCEP